MFTVTGNAPRFIPGILAAMVIMIPPSFTETFRVRWLCEPAAHLASAWMTCPLVHDEATLWPMLLTRYGTVRVSPDCAGLTFLMISLSLACWHLLRGVAGRKLLGRLLLCCMLAGTLTLFLNTARILLVATSIPILHRLADPVANVLHVGLGVVVFLPGLMLFSALLSRNKDTHEPAPA